MDKPTNQNNAEKIYTELGRLDGKHKEDTRILRAHFTDIRVNERSEVLELIFETKIKPYILSKDNNEELNVFINKHVLNELLYSYFYDIDRLKDFHDIKYANESKKAAYLIKWITFHRPIQYDYRSIKTPEARAFLLLVNQYFAFRCALAYTRIELEDVDDKLMSGFLYELTFRPSCESILSFWFETYYLLKGIKTSAKDEEDNGEV